MIGLLRFWLTFNGQVDRRTYFHHGLTLMALKYAGDVVIVWLLAGRLWTPADYFNSVDTLLTGRLSLQGGAVVTLALWTLPFMWTGVTMTVRRAIDAGWSGWVAALFFVPFVNYALMLLLAARPTRARAADMSHPVVDEEPFPLGVAVAAGVAVGLGMLIVGVHMAANYSAALFIGTPFMMGAMTSFVANRASLRRRRVTTIVVVAMVLVVTMLVIVGGADGLICLLMAFPLAIPLVFLGAEMGRAIAEFESSTLAPALLALLVLPANVSLEAMSTRIPVAHEVRTAIDIDAPPERVWRHVIAFDPIPQPAELLFRLGVAYPRHARIDGSGVGAVRYCIFSTGAFVEPITAWEPGRRLAFDVIESPSPLRELTFYKNLAPPHLDGYLRSRRGEFRLVKLPGGRTRLEGSTWYELDMAPLPYWQMFSDAIIHRIHLRVLEHIRAAAERP